MIAQTISKYTTLVVLSGAKNLTLSVRGVAR